MGIKKVGIERKYASYDEFKSEHVLAQGWPALGDLSFLFRCADERVGDFIDGNVYEESRNKARNAFSQLLAKIAPGDIILSLEGNTIKGIAEMPENFIYFYNDAMKEYKQCLYPVNWVDWISFCPDPNLVAQGGQGVKGIENCCLEAVNDYIVQNWPAFKENNNYSPQMPQCREKLKNLEDNFPNIVRRQKLDPIIRLLRNKRQIILQGAPGTGKTYLAMVLAACLANPCANIGDDAAMTAAYQSLVNTGRIKFVTFHMSMDYENFIEGIKPGITSGKISYRIKNGIFKTICRLAANDKDNSYILIIDEINRGNISKIFGELITLIEADKRSGGTHPLEATLTYSKHAFSVPDHLYIIGTMNTTDRSTGSIDYALRRRFAFVPVNSDLGELDLYYKSDLEQGSKAKELFNKVYKFLTEQAIDGNADDLMIGHSYFMAPDSETLDFKWRYEVLPLLDEYFKDGLIKTRWQE